MVGHRSIIIRFHFFIQFSTAEAVEVYSVNLVTYLYDSTLAAFFLSPFPASDTFIVCILVSHPNTIGSITYFHLAAYFPFAVCLVFAIFMA